MRSRLFAALLFLAGIVLLFAPLSHAQASPAFIPTRFTVTVEGAPKGPAVILLPGLASSQSVFDAEARILAPTYRLYRVQVDGFAGAPAGANATGPVLEPIVAELHQYILASQIHPAVIGHSLGGLLALMLADEHPADIQKLLIVDTLPFYALVFNPYATVDSIKPQGLAMRSQFIDAPDPDFAAGAAQSSNALVNDPAAKILVTAMATSSNRTVFAEAMYEDLTTDMRPRLATIKVPFTLLYPYDPKFQGADPSAVDSLYKSAYAAMPNLTLHRIDASRHFIMYDQPAAFDAQVQSFLK
jgi:pimeloyl-ACP methyl ester carboxylesterase